MNTRLHQAFMTAIVAVSLGGCASPELNGDRAATDPQAPRGTDSAEAAPPLDTAAQPADGAPMRTATVHALRARVDGFSAEIPYVYTNRSGGPIYLVNCNGDVSPALQRRVGDRWEGLWSPATNACLSPPVVVESGATLADTLHMVITQQDGPILSEFVAAVDSGTYRLIWHQAFTAYSSEGRPVGPPAPLEERVSNAFSFRRD